MPSSFREPKSLPDWLQMDYFRHERVLRRLKGPLVVAAMLLSLVGVTVALAVPRGRQVYQAGPVSRGHAIFADQCAECHTHAFRTAGRFIQVSERPTVSDDACVNCHGEHPHHPAEEAHTAGCATCHREHRGRPALAQVADGHCTACHADLSQAIKKDMVKPNYSDIKDFAGHPDFAMWDKLEKVTAGMDPGRLNFSHQAHLVPLAMPRKGPEAPVVLHKLECGECHQPDAGGLAMQPVRFDTHCAKCHLLQAPLKVEGSDKATREAVEAFRQEPLPHPGPGQSAETVRGVLRDRLTRLAQENPKIVPAGGAAEPERPIPGPRRAPNVSGPAFQWVDEHLGEAERVLFDKKAGCLLCHQELGQAEKRARGLPVLAPPNVPDRWLAHSAFSHRSHQAQPCTKCHEKAPESTTARDVLMPHINDCRRCHNPEVGVRSDCAGCHAYHKPEVRLKGVRTLEECLMEAAKLDGRPRD
jgi:hypothetical protein